MTTGDNTNMRIVVVDDDEMMLRAVDAQLQEFGFTPKTFSDPLKAIKWIGENGADIVISDIMMPGCSGFEVLKKVKETDPKCDVIFITAHGELENAIRALREGATDFFEKPFTGQTLRAAVERTTKFRVLSQQRELLASQVNLLSDELSGKATLRPIMLGRSDTMKRVAQDIIDVASSNTTVLILGESGTGKELVARSIHDASPRSQNPFLVVNCPSIPEDLFESEIFGHRKGSFTGAVETRGGYMEAASGGTLLLDEIGDMPPKSQAKILRLLEQKTYLPVGEHEERVADVRIIAATNQSLEQLVKERKFREDLFYRLNVFSITLPPLRRRLEDIALLALYFALQYASEMGKSIDGIRDDALGILMSYSYPGNVRELRNIMESSVIHCKHGGQLTPDDLPPAVKAAPHADATGDWPLGSVRFEDVEKQLYIEALSRTNSNVSAAAKLVGLSRGKLRRRLVSLDIAVKDS